jgi:crossover junction endodeoxyribonuclease RuvC
VIEGVIAPPGNGNVPMFGVGRSLCVVKGVVAANFIPILAMPHPERMGARPQTSVRKERGARHGRQLFPAATAIFARVNDDGRAEAAVQASLLSHDVRPPAHPARAAPARSLGLSDNLADIPR